MINYWWVTRPKRKLTSIPEVLAVFSDVTMGRPWQGARDLHLAFEEALENAGLKRVGTRRDRTGGGGRTYLAWLKSLGLVFEQEDTGQMRLTLAGEAIMQGQSPVGILKNQVMKYQIPSPSSVRNKVADDIKVRPFRFLLKLLRDRRLDYYLTKEEIGKIVIVDARKESNACYEMVVKKIVDFRSYGNTVLDSDFVNKYTSSKGVPNISKPYDHLLDVANTIINWIEYTQLVKRDFDIEKKLRILTECEEEVDNILATTPLFIDRWNQQEYYQRKYGVDPLHTKDTRSFTGTNTVTARMINEEKIRRAFIALSLRQPIASVTSSVIDSVVEATGVDSHLVEDTLQRVYPRGAISGFMTEYFEMAFRGRDNATDFERATVDLFREAFGFETEHVGPIGLTPDVLLISDSEGYCGIIDNKAYSNYTVSNDHKNRMIHNYIANYSINQRQPLAFFNYIAGGFGNSIDNSIRNIADETGVNGSAITVSNMIKFVELFGEQGYDQGNIRELFSLNRQIRTTDLLM